MSQIWGTHNYSPCIRVTHNEVRIIDRAHDHVCDDEVPPPPPSPISSSRDHTGSSSLTQVLMAFRSHNNMQIPLIGLSVGANFPVKRNLPLSALPHSTNSMCLWYRMCVSDLLLLLLLQRTIAVLVCVASLLWLLLLSLLFLVMLSCIVFVILVTMSPKLLKKSIFDTF